MPETIGLSAGSVYATMTLENAPFLAGLAQSNAAMKAAAQDIEAHFGQVQAALGRVSTGLLAISAVGVAGLVLATREAAAFEKAFAKVAGFTDASTAEIERLKKAVLGMKDLPQMPTELAQGLFYVRSAGFAGADAMTVLHAAGKAAAAGMGETKDVALATVRALTAYQMGASQAAHVTDILAMTATKGNVHIEELAPSLGKILPIASSLGVSLEQVGASMATMTRIGLNAAESAIALRGVLGALGMKEGKQADAALKQIGLTWAGLRAELVQKGLFETLNHLISKAGGDETILARVIPNIRAITGVMATAGRQADAYREILDSLAHSQGAVDRAFAASEQTFDARLEHLKKSMATAGIAIGTALLPAAGAVADRLRAIGEVLQTVNPNALAFGLGATLLGAGLAKLAQMGFAVVGAIQAQRIAYVAHAATLGVDTAAVVENLRAQVAIRGAELEAAEAVEYKAAANVQDVASTETATAADLQQAATAQADAIVQRELAAAELAAAAGALDQAEAAGASTASMWASMTAAQKFAGALGIIGAAAAVVYGVYQLIEWNAGRASAAMVAQAKEQEKAADSSVNLAQIELERQRQEGQSLRSLGDEWQRLAKSKRPEDHVKLNSIMGQCHKIMTDLSKAVGDQAPKWDGTAKSVIAYANALNTAAPAMLRLYRLSAQLEELTARSALLTARQKAIGAGITLGEKIMTLGASGAVGWAPGFGTSIALPRAQAMTPAEQARDQLARVRKNLSPAEQRDLRAAELVYEIKHGDLEAANKATAAAAPIPGLPADVVAGAGKSGKAASAAAAEKAANKLEERAKKIVEEAFAAAANEIETGLKRNDPLAVAHGYEMKRKLLAVIDTSLIPKLKEGIVATPAGTIGKLKVGGEQQQSLLNLLTEKSNTLFFDLNALTTEGLKRHRELTDQQAAQANDFRRQQVAVAERNREFSSQIMLQQYIRDLALRTLGGRREEFEAAGAASAGVRAMLVEDPNRKLTEHQQRLLDEYNVTYRRLIEAQRAYNDELRVSDDLGTSLAQSVEQEYNWRHLSAQVAHQQLDLLTVQLWLSGQMSDAADEAFRKAHLAVAEADVLRTAPSRGTGAAATLEFERGRLAKAGRYMEPAELRTTQDRIMAAERGITDERLTRLNEEAQAREEGIRGGDLWQGAALGEAVASNWQDLTQKASLLLGAQFKLAGPKMFGVLTEEEITWLAKLQAEVDKANVKLRDSMHAAADYAKEQWDASWGKAAETLAALQRGQTTPGKVLTDAAQQHMANIWRDLMKAPDFAVNPQTGKTEPVAGTGGALGVLADKIQRSMGKLSPDAQKALGIGGDLFAFAGALRGTAGEKPGAAALSGGLAGLSAGMDIAKLAGIAPGPIGVGMAIVGAVLGFSSARKAAEEAAARQREAQLTELRKMNNALRPMSDYFNRGAFGALTQSLFWGGGLEAAWAADGMAGVR